VNGPGTNDKQLERRVVGIHSKASRGRYLMGLGRLPGPAYLEGPVREGQ